MSSGSGFPVSGTSPGRVGGFDDVAPATGTGARDSPAPGLEFSRPSAIARAPVRFPDGAPGGTDVASILDRVMARLLPAAGP